MKNSCILLAMMMIVLCGCSPSVEKPSLVIYSSIDELWSAPIFKQFTKETGIEIKAVYDSEANKSVGLANRLIAEKSLPVADLYWSGEPLQIQRLAAAEVLLAYKSAGIELPEYYSQWDNQSWFPNSFRQRVFVINTNLVTKLDDCPESIYALTNQMWKGKIAMANPKFGSTLFHFASIYAEIGPRKFTKFLKNIKNNEVKIMAGNSQVAIHTKNGNVAIGLTDNDDATREIAKKAPLIMQGVGTYFASGIGIINREEVKKDFLQQFVNYLLSDEVQKKLHDQAPYNYMVKTVLGEKLSQDNAQILVKNMPALMEILNQEKL